MSPTHGDVRIARNFLAAERRIPCVIDHKGDFLAIYSP